MAPYLNSTQANGKKLLMFETNSASCGGFVGISDSFGAALWGLDYTMQMAFSNFSASQGQLDISRKPSSHSTPALPLFSINNTI